MIGQTISHFHILEKSRPNQRLGRGSSFRSSSGTGLGEGGPAPACVPVCTLLAAGRPNTSAGRRRSSIYYYHILT